MTAISDFTIGAAKKNRKFNKYANQATELAAIVTALGTDTTVHTTAIDIPPAALRIGAAQTAYTNHMLLVVNKGRAANLTAAQMATALGSLPP